MLCYEIGSNALSGMALISSSAMFPNLQWSDLTRHVLIIISEEQAKVHKPKRPLENSPQTWLIITSALFFWSKQITGLPFPLSPSRRVKTGRNRLCLRDLQLYSENHFVLGTFLLSVSHTVIPKELS